MNEQYPFVELAITRYGGLKSRPIRVRFGPHSAHARLLTIEEADELATALICYAEDAREQLDDSPIEDERANAVHSKLPKCPRCGGNIITKRDHRTLVVCTTLDCEYGSTRNDPKNKVTVHQHLKVRNETVSDQRVRSSGDGAQASETAGSNVSAPDSSRSGGVATGPGDPVAGEVELRATGDGGDCGN